MSTFPLQDTIIADLKSIGTDLGNQVFTWHGEDYGCIASSRGKTDVLGDGGFSVDADLSISVLKELFSDGNYPKPQQKIIYKSRGYRIQTVRQDTTDAFIRLICTDDMKGI